jgi:16S rRNA processing protein RimM
VAPAINLLAVGRITAVYGVKGWIKIHSATDPAQNIFAYKPWYIDDGQTTCELEVDDFRSHGKGYVAHIYGVDSRDIALEYCGKDIWIEKKQLPALGIDQYYWHELTGLKVYCVGGCDRVLSGDKILLGTIAGLMETGANDVLVVESCEGSVDEQQHLVPWLDDFLHAKCCRPAPAIP